MARDGGAQTGVTAVARPTIRLFDRCFQQTTELAREIDRHARVHGALLVEEALRSADREYALVPDVRMDVEPAACRRTGSRRNPSGVTSSPGSASGTRNGFASSGKKSWPPSGW